MIRLTVASSDLAEPAALLRVRPLRLEERDLAAAWIPGVRRGRRVLEERWRFLEPQVRDGRYLAVVERGGIVSYASVLEPRHGAGEITVATHPARRRKGLASAVVAAAAHWCLARDLMPLYVVDERNGPSVRLAESLGFRRGAEEISVAVWRRGPDPHRP